jgi:hypothetical protein
MAIRKPTRPQTNEPTPAEIERVINAGSPPPAPKIQEVTPSNEIKFQMVIPADLCEVIDKARSLTRTSRRTWLLQAAQEKLEREGRLHV